ncbi:hypothetical protein M2311_000499 [Rhizobium leguminosarum]|nr:hypothetical protein [Rhizobium leguminosarum]
MKLTSDSAAAPRNGTRGPNSPSKPPMTGPIVKPTPKAMPISPKFFARFSSVLISAI